MKTDFRQHWLLDPNIDFLNHGSFGATPACVLQAQREWQDLLECDPIQFLAPERTLEPKLDEVRRVVSDLVGSLPENLAWVRNATDGVNAVVRSFPFCPGDEILVTSHGYNACINAAVYAAEAFSVNLPDEQKVTVKTVPVPFPLVDSMQVVDAVREAMGDRTRLLLIDHVTSPTGLVFPITEIIQVAHHRGVRVLVDGAHAPGMIPLNLDQLGADYYTANHHKWLCGPKVSGFLWVRPELQNEVRPTVISHAANRGRPGRSRFLAEFDWTGTFDPTPILALPTAIEFLGSLYDGGLPSLMHQNRQKTLAGSKLLLDSLEIASPAPEEMLGSLATIPIPGWAGQADKLREVLREQHCFELPVFSSPVDGECLLRISMQAYNDLSQIQRLADVLNEYACG